jgi:hypothetical protein
MSGIEDAADCHQLLCGEQGLPSVRRRRTVVPASVLTQLSGGVQIPLAALASNAFGVLAEGSRASLACSRASAGRLSRAGVPLGRGTGALAARGLSERERGRGQNRGWPLGCEAKDRPIVLQRA